MAHGMKRWLNIGCGPHRAADPWWNVDVITRPEHPAPDEIVVPGSLPYADGSAERIYAGHILEHVHLDDVGDLLADWRRVLAHGGELCVVGPDVERSLEMWKRGRLSKESLWSIMEHPGNYLADEPGRHKWNCTPARVSEIAERVGFTCTEVDIKHLRGWPLVSDVGWQFALIGAAS